MSGENDMSAYAEIFASESQEFLQLMNDALLAMEEHPKAFPPIASGMTQAAEASGELPAILIRLAEHIEKRLEVR